MRARETKVKIQYEGNRLDDLFSSLFGVSPQVAVQYQFVTCCACGTPFAIEARLHRSLVETHRAFYCPNGHGQSFVGETEAERLKKQLAREAKQREALETQAKRAQAQADQERHHRELTERSLRATKAVVTKIKNRVARGVCPCCNRTFANLARHMQTKHPNYQDDKAQAA